MHVPQAAERLQLKINEIIRKHGEDQPKIDKEISRALDANELLTIGLMPINAILRTYVVGCLLRDNKREQNLSKLSREVEKDELIPVEVHGGGKCKITIFMTKAARDRERDA